MALPLRFREPTIDTSPGDSYIDSIAEAQGKERAIVAALADDAYTEQLRPPMVALLNSCEDARRVIWRARDKFAAKMAAAQGLVQASGDAAAGAMPRQGWGAPIDLQAAQSGARRDVARQAEILVGREVAEKYAQLGADTAEAFHASFVTLADAFEQAYSDWSGPAALRSGSGKLSLDDLHRQVGVEGELRAARSPMSEAIAMWASISKSGDAAKIDLFIRAARSIALETTQSPPPRLALRLNGRDQVDDERALAFRLLDLFAKYRVTSRPPSLDAAGDLLGWMRQHAMLLFGVMPVYQTPAEYLIRNIPINSRQIDAAKLPWELQAGWIGRYVGHGAMALPGWSPIVSKTSGGAFVRQPAGG